MPNAKATGIPMSMKRTNRINTSVIPWPLCLQSRSGSIRRCTEKTVCQMISPLTPSLFVIGSPVAIARQKALIFRIAVMSISAQPIGTLSVTHV